MRIKSTGTLFLLLCSFFTTSLTFGQSAIRFKNDRATPSEDLIYREHFKEYTIATLNTNQVALMLQSQPEFESLSIEFDGKSYTFSLRAHDLRAPHYKLRAATDAGIIEMPRSVNKTYFGYTKNGNHDVRITADDDTFYGLIVQGNDAYYIEPAR